MFIKRETEKSSVSAPIISLGRPMAQPERWKSYKHQRETTVSSNDSLQLRPFWK